MYLVIAADGLEHGGLPTRTVVDTAAALTALVFAGVCGLLWLRPPRPRVAEPVTVAIALLVLGNLFLQLRLTPSPVQTTGFMLALIAAGGLLLSPRWLAWVVAAGAGGWLSQAYEALHLPVWRQHGLALVASIGVAFALLHGRRRTLDRLDAAARSADRFLRERDRAFGQLELTEERLRRCSAASRDGIAILEDGVVVDGNLQLERLFGRRLDAIRGRRPDELMLPKSDDREGSTASDPASTEALGVHADGTLFPVEVVHGDVDNEAVDGSDVVVLRDLRERRTGERYALALEATHEGLWDWGIDTGEFYVSSRWCELVGTTLRQLTGSPGDWLERVHPADRPAVDRAVERCVDGQLDAIEVECRLRHGDGTDRRFLVRGTAAHNAAGRTERLVGSLCDVTERHRAEETSRRLQAVVEATTDIVATADARGRVTYLNGAGRALLGVRESLPDGMALTELHTEPSARLLRDRGLPAAARDGIWSGETDVLRGDGRPVRMSQVVLAHRNAAGELEYFSTIARDLTDREAAERRRLQLEARQKEAQKLESLGVLAGGIAHDFNNILTSVIGNASLVRARLPEDSPLCSQLERVENEATRAADLTRSLLAFAGKGQVLRQTFELHRLVRELEPELRRTATVGTRLCFDHQETPVGTVEGDGTQIRQVVSELVRNAVEAIGEDGGTVVVRTRVLDGDPGVGEGRRAYLEVSDTGSGMDAETRRRMFEPFFTTHFIGRGLGMAAVSGIVRAHHGAIDVWSEPGRGTSVRVQLPLRESPAADPTEEPGPAPSTRSSGRRVLVVDDEESVREIVAAALEAAGMDVVTAVDGEQGVELFRRESGRFRVVLLDLAMPRMDGHAAHAAIRELSPDVPVILMSGYDESEATDRFDDAGLAGFLQKPFLPSQLTRMVERLTLERRAS